MHRESRRCRPGSGLVVWLVLAWAGGCGGAGDAGDVADAASAQPGLAPCAVLTAEEVTVVLPGHDDGIATRTGGSLVEGVDVWECTWTAQGEGPADFDLLTLTVTVASTADQAAGFRPSPDTLRSRHETFEEVAAGEGGYAYGAPGDMMVDAWSGTRLVSLELVVDGAEGRVEDLVGLAADALSRIE